MARSRVNRRRELRRARLLVWAGQASLFGLIVFGIVGCIAILSAKSPIGSISSAETDNTNTTDTRVNKKSLIVMLPGMGDRAKDFVKAGFIDSGPHVPYDVIAVDAHFGYYRERNLVPRLREDIIGPARADGYENIWLLGISMGGFGSLLYVAAHPDEICGVILLSPYLGSRKLIREIEASGGLRKWQEEPKEFEPHEIELWSWLKEATSSPRGTRVILGYGRGERMAAAYGPLLQVLDSSDVYVREGRHKWTTWKPLWKRISAELDISLEKRRVGVSFDGVAEQKSDCAIPIYHEVVTRNSDQALSP